MKALLPRTAIHWALAMGIAFSPCSAQETSTSTHSPNVAAERSQGPELLSFDELVALASTARPEGALGDRLNALLNTPFVHRENATDIQPHRPNVSGLGPVLRVGLWNIERGLNFDEIRSALSDPRAFLRMTRTDISSRRRETVESQLGTLQGIDVLVLNEADWGMKRTEYRDITRELASALHMNYAYGVEFVEVDPVFDLDTEQLHLADALQDQRLHRDLQVDRRRYRGLHGTAILSRYPIESARIFRLPVCYDWYREEYKAISRLEHGKRWSAHKLFRERVERELRQGSRMALIAEISVPDLPTGQATIVATHLENKCAPACRRRQMEALLANLKSDNNPMVLAGDLNTTGRDNTPTSIRNEIMTRVVDYKFWIGQAVSQFNPLGLFQYTGEPGRTLPPRGHTLADSNQRGGKGFIPTYSFARNYGGLVGQFKLDWIFVKPFANDPRRVERGHQFAPHFPVTMRELNDSVEDRISDHPPMTVDLPLMEPTKLLALESSRSKWEGDARSR